MNISSYYPPTKWLELHDLETAELGFEFSLQSQGMPPYHLVYITRVGQANKGVSSETPPSFLPALARRWFMDLGSVTHLCL